MAPKKGASRDVANSRSRAGMTSKVSGNSSRKGIAAGPSGANSAGAQVKVIWPPGPNGRDMTPMPLLAPLVKAEPGAGAKEDDASAPAGRRACLLYTSPSPRD